MVIFGIISNTYKDCVRQPLYFIVLVIAISMIGLFPLLSFFVFNEQLKMVLDSSLASILLFSMIMAVLLSGNSIYRDISSGNISLILSKPVSRNLFLVGRIIGVMLALTQFVAVCGLSAIVSLYIAADQFNLDYKIFYVFYAIILSGCIFGFLMNYFLRKSFAGGSILGITILICAQTLFLLLTKFNFLDENNLSLKSIAFLIILILLAIWMIVNISMAISTRFDLVVNLILTFIVLILGLLSDYLVGSYVQNGSLIFAAVYAILPNWQFFWLVDAVTEGRQIPFIYMIFAFLYSICYLIATFCIASISFGTIEAAKAFKD